MTNNTLERQHILDRCLEAVKQCQVRFGGNRAELATESDSRQVSEITGLSKMASGIIDISSMETEPVFWSFIRTVLSQTELQRYELLNNVNTDAGRGRAWLRSSINEHSLERYTHMLLESNSNLRVHYDDWALMRDEERSSMLPSMAAGLNSILFAIRIDNAALNVIKPAAGFDAFRANTVVIEPTAESFPDRVQPEQRPVIAGQSSSPVAVRKKEKRKKKKAAIISFGDEGDDQQRTTSSSSYINELLETNSLPTSQSIAQEPLKHSSQDNTNQSLDFVLPKSDSIENESSIYDTHDPAVKDKFHCGNFEPGNFSEELEYNPTFTSTSFDTVSNSSNGASSAQNGADRSAGYSDVTSSPSAVVLTPLGPEGQEIGSFTAVVTSSEVTSDDSTSYASVSSYTEETDSAVLGLSAVQRSISATHRTQGDGRVATEASTSSNTQSSMSTEELRQAVVAMMMRKDEVEEKNKVLKSILTEEQELSVALRAEVADLKRIQTQKNESHSDKVKALVRENDLLKHQLRKYVNAVQMLRRNESVSNSDLHGIHTADSVEPAIPPAKSNIDYSHEANEYEQKLIQVAEMHGELMEFNEVLHRQLNARNAQVKSLKAELVELRGPLPNEMEEIASEMRQQAESDSGSANARTLINVWIPSAFLRGSGGDAFHVYQIYVRVRDEEWNVYRRYAEFHALNSELRKKVPLIATLQFPKKQALGYKSAKVVEQRRKVLQVYLRKMLNILSQNNPALTVQASKKALLKMLPFFGESTTALKKTKSPRHAETGQQYMGL